MSTWTSIGGFSGCGAGVANGTVCVGHGFAVVVGFFVTVAAVVVVGAAGMIHVVITKCTGGGGVAGGGGGGATAVAQGFTGGGGTTAAWASILAMRACDLYIMPRRLSQSSLECNVGVS